jgi:hypothetical protein
MVTSCTIVKLFQAGSWIYKINIPEENIIIIFFKCSWVSRRRV